uniref:Venom cystatin 6 n=1 Tax=Oncocephalus sp. TaxID=2944721 RepID=A0AB38ZEP3_9HEMI
MLKCASIILVFATVFLLNYGEAANVKKPCRGCPEDLKLDDKELKRTLKMVLASKNAKVTIVKIVSAKIQVVGGMKYSVDFNAKDNATKEMKYCSATYISKEWKRELKVLHFQCNSK